MDLSIILPVYNVENYIRPCMDSIFKQRLDENVTEVIIINDGTKDRSMEMIADIINQHDNITVINQENQGLSVARNKGIATAKGKYVLMLDSDDLLIDNSLKKLLEIALESEADLVVADFLSMTSQEIENTNISMLEQTDFNYKEKSGTELFLQDLNPHQCFVWRTLFKRAFLINNNLTFVPGIYIQDVPFTHECYLKANKCIRTSWILNIYRHGHRNAASTIFNKKKAKDFCIAIAKTWELNNIEKISSKEQIKLQNDVYISFSTMIKRTIYEIENTSDHFEIIDFLRRQAPDLFFRNSIKQRVVSYLYNYLPHSFIYLMHLYAIYKKNHLFSSLYKHPKRRNSKRSNS